MFITIHWTHIRWGYMNNWINVAECLKGDWILYMSNVDEDCKSGLWEQTYFRRENLAKVAEILCVAQYQRCVPSSTEESAESQECRAMQCKEVPWYTSKKANKTFHHICTREEDFNQATSTLFTALRQRGYCKRKLRHIKSDFLKSKQAPRPRLGTTLNLPLITRYGRPGSQNSRGPVWTIPKRICHTKGVQGNVRIQKSEGHPGQYKSTHSPRLWAETVWSLHPLSNRKKYREQCNREERPDSAEDNLWAKECGVCN